MSVRHQKRTVCSVCREVTWRKPTRLLVLEESNRFPVWIQLEAALCSACRASWLATATPAVGAGVRDVAAVSGGAASLAGGSPSRFKEPAPLSELELQELHLWRPKANQLAQRDRRHHPPQLELRGSHNVHRQRQRHAE